jgi:hypothetical protein
MQGVDRCEEKREFVEECSRPARVVLHMTRSR